MLINYGQFQLRQAVKSPAHLLHPRTVKQSNVSMPKLSVIHLLELDNDEIVPKRNSRYLVGVPDNKRVPIHHVQDLVVKQEVQMLDDKFMEKKLREWLRPRMKEFRLFDLTTLPNPDQLTNGIVNYNPIKNLYRFKATLTSGLSRYVSIMSTYWTVVSESVRAVPTANHFVTIPIPTAIPSRNLINRIMEFSPTRFAAVVKSPELNGLLQLFRYITPDQRANSTMAALTEEDAKKLTVEFTYKGYSVFCKLEYILALHKDSTLESKVKLPTERLQHLLLAMFLKTQKNIEDKIAGLDPTLSAEDEADEVFSNNPDNDTPPPVVERDHVAELDDELEENDLVVDEGLPDVGESDIVVSGVAKSPRPVGFDKKFVSKQIDTSFDTKADEKSMAAMIDASLSELEGGSDDMFMKSVAKAANLTENREEVVSGEPEVNPHEIDRSPETIERLLKTPTPDQVFENFLVEAKSFDAISTAEARTLRKAFETRKELKSPYSKNQQIDEFKQRTPEELVLKPKPLTINNDLVPDIMKQEVLLNLDREYTKGPMKKHIVACVTAVERAGVLVKDYQVETVATATGRYEVHKLILRDLKAGKDSPVYFRIPVINSEGEYIAGGIKYRMRRQKTDVIIRKISPIKVGISTNYNKLFVSRTERKAYDPYARIADQIKVDYLSNKGNIVKIAPGNRFRNEFKAPNIYSAMSQHFNDITTPEYQFFFNADEISNRIDEKTIADLNKRELVFIGHDRKGQILVVDKDDMIYNYTAGMTELHSLPSILGLDESKIPPSFTMMKVLGDAIPLGVILSYYMGLNGLIAVTRSQMKVYPPNARITTNGPLEVMLKFSDARIVIECSNQEAKLLFSGFQFYRDFTKTQTLESFYDKPVYLSLLEFRDAGLMHLRELDILRTNFIDPISEDVLREMGEPTDFIPLLLRANQLLVDFQHLDINDPTLARVRSYDRVPGLIYRAMTEAVRAQRAKGGRGKIELDPYKVWKYVTQDTTVKVTEDNNPVTDTKEMESVTFTGLDGLSRTATPEKLRRFHIKDKGLASEATVDSTDVALNLYTPPIPKIKNLLGAVDVDNKDYEENPELLFSTSMLLSPMAEYDDPKRQNFISIQNGHTIAAAGYQQSSLRTGYEYVMPYRVGKMYCAMAEEDGKVTKVTKSILQVTYKSGKTDSIRIGENFGRMEGSIYKHTLFTDKKEGSTFKAGDWLMYNTGFFEPDWLDPSRIVMKFGRLITVAFVRNDEVYEDSSSISPELSALMSSTVVKEKKFIIEFGKHIISMVPEGEHVTPTDYLFTVVDENTDFSNLSESSIELLKGVGNTSPKAKVDGKVFRYEIKYNGELSDMSPSLRKLANRLDKQLYEETEGTEEEATNNRVTDYLSDGKPLMPQTLELKVFIESEAKTGVTDKGVYGAQMKSEVSKVFTQNITTESGRKVDAMFSYTSLLARIVLSPTLMGTTNTIVKAMSPRFAKAYFES